ncbi:DNA polymerase III subunit beta [Sphingobium sp. JS3065]|uniref:DNA polymerase III subunit beta n=1 Tax=Sphingobium sp. JS3065 TaxID=2970925 RepID=UPI00226500E7|nr:DNA polymerase III subunit beta [Sphingobium sp. JS3065]UZW55535.1 DNA polymerase III subunit beta [Sphingobium sp. JS3065]
MAKASAPEAPAQDKEGVPARAPREPVNPPIIEVGVKQLRAAMKGVTEAIEARNTIPILANVLINCDGRRLTLIATDLDMMIEATVEAQKARGIAVTVSGKLLEDIAKKLPAEALVTMVMDGSQLIVSAGRARFRVPTLPVTDFPIMGSPDWQHEFESPASDWTRMLDAVRFAMANDENRYYLNGIYLHETDGGKLGAAATDGHRLAVFRMDMPDGGGGLSPIIIGRKAVGIVAKMLDELKPGDDGVSPPVEFATDGAKARFDFGTVTLTTKLIDAEYPNYGRVIPSATDRRCTFTPALLHEAVDRVTVVSSEKTRLVKADFKAATVLLEAASPENGRGTEELPVEHDGDDLTIGFNGGYLLAILEHLKGTTAEVLMSDQAGPTLWRTDDDAPAFYVLMPMRV